MQRAIGSTRTIRTTTKGEKRPLNSTALKRVSKSLLENAHECCFLGFLYRSRVRSWPRGACCRCHRRCLAGELASQLSLESQPKFLAAQHKEKTMNQAI